MSNPNVCACPNLKCPNHGNCKDCTSRHLKIETLNYCSFHSVLPFLEELANSSPESEASGKVKSLIRKHFKAYEKLMETNCLTEENQKKLRLKKSEVSLH